MCVPPFKAGLLKILCTSHHRPGAGLMLLSSAGLEYRIPTTWLEQ